MERGARAPSPERGVRDMEDVGVKRSEEEEEGADILVVDDEPDVANLIAINLEFEGYRVRKAHGGRQALEEVARKRPDCVLLDIMMPEVDGWEVLRRLKEEPETAGIPVIVVTARNTDMDHIKGLGGGAVDYITKPFDTGVLRTHVARALRERDRELVEQAREDRVRRLQLSTLRDITEKLISTLEIEDILEAIADRLLNLFDLDICALCLPDPTGRRFHLASCRSRLPLSRREEGAFDITRDRIAELAGGDPFSRGGLHAISSEDFAGGEVAGVLSGLRSLHLLALQAREKPVGVIFLGHREEVGFGEQERELLAAIGNQAAIAIENARLYDDLRYDEEVHRQLLQRVITAQEDERRRVAMELHDGVIQNLVSAAFRLQLCSARLESDPEEARRALLESREIIDAGIAEMRRIISGLRPSILDDLGLSAALQKYIMRLQEETPFDIHIELEETGIPPLTTEAETALFRIAQEALNNVVRHSRCRRARVTIGVEDGELFLRVEDDGVGFEPPGAQRRTARSYGLVGMRERAESLGGTMAVESAPGEGTSVEVRFPLYAVTKEG